MEEKIADCPLGAKCEEVKFDSDRKPVLYRCPWFVRVRGTDNNTGEEVDSWSCAIAWMPTLMINAANESRKGVAAIESFRNEMAKQKLMPLASHMPQPANLLQEKEICD